VTPLAGLFFQGATLTEYDDLAPGTGVVGRPVWGRTALLDNLELRLGLPAPLGSHAIRLQQWSRHLADVTKRGPRFYSKSYEVDPVGTARTLLDWRDSLVDAGWNGDPIPGGGSRLETFVELEREGPVLAGKADRLMRVELELSALRARPWEELALAEPAAAWPWRWQRVFSLLEQRGTTIRTARPNFEAVSADSDLGRLQASIRGATVPRGFQGDGTLVVLTGESSWELAQAAASILRQWDDGSSAVVRSGESLALDAAITAQGLASQGVDSQSAWRPALQLLPLAVELTYTPHDPYRVLELVTLPLGPFAGWVGLQLARAVSSAPGIGGRAWQEAKRSITASFEQQAQRDIEQGADPTIAAMKANSRLQRISDWLEAPGYDALQGAPHSTLLEVSARVADWLQKRLAQSAMADQAGTEQSLHDVAILGAAFAQAQSFHKALSHDARDRLDLVSVRQLMQEVSSGRVALPLAIEQAGRMDVVDSPAALRCSRNLVVWWHCVGGTQAAAVVNPWRLQERDSLRAAGIGLPDESALLAAEVEGWRGVVLAARQRLVLAVPATARGQRLEPHPIWDELAARVDAKSPDVARVTLSADDIIARSNVLSKQLPSIATVPLGLLTLPQARAAWNLDAALVGVPDRYTATSVEDLLGCPLRWLFRNRAGLGGRWAVSIPSGPLLNGRLGHRLIEELHVLNAVGDPERAGAAFTQVLERLLLEEAAVLLRPGMTFELSQLRQQLGAAVLRLADLLAQNGLAVIGVESEASADWGGRKLEGRIDLLLADREGREVVFDLKWGRSSYLKKLEAGLALQLAVYAGARQIERAATALPAGAYFALSKGQLLTTERGPFGSTRLVDGPRIAETWGKLEHTVVVIEKLLSRGIVPATGLKTSLALLASAGIEERDRERYLAPEPPCEYCDHKSLCGVAWEHLA
jgi:ATP-dependent helicase/nuclease subunit B